MSLVRVLRAAPFRRRTHVAGLAFLTCSLAASGLGLARQNKPAEKEPPPPEDFELTTKDGVLLKGTWWASVAGNQAPVVILLHGFHGDRGEFRELADFLQRERGFAVVAPDLRGHGDSTTYTDENGQHELTPDRLKPADFEAMSTQDVEAIKRFLIKRHNAGELNIERLGIAGAGMGALVAVAWATMDWEFDTLPTIKQGRDVKALALMSPEMRFKNLNTTPLAEEPLRGEIALQIIAGGGDARSLRDAKHLHNLVKRFYLETTTPAGPQKLFLDTGYQTSLQGTKMLGKKLGLEDRMARFFEIQLVEPVYEWKERKSPL